MKYNFDEIIERRGTNAYKYDGMKDICGRDDVLPMWVADMEFATPPFVISAIQKQLENRILGYTCGGQEYKDAITAWCSKQYDWSVCAGEISYIPGVVAGIFLAVQAFTEKGDTILIQDPVYHPFKFVPEGSGRIVKTNSLVTPQFSDAEDGGDWTMDLEQFRRDVHGCRMFILCNPHNPIGICWSKETLQQVAKICAEEGVLVVSDEIHCDMVLGGRRHVPFATVCPEAADIAITLMAPSKVFNMPGVVCSHTIAKNPELRKRFFSYIENSDMDLGNAFCYKAAIACYSNEGDEWRREMLDYVQGNIDLLAEMLAPYSDRIKVIRPQASFLAMLDCRGLGFVTQQKLNDFMVNKCGLCLNPGDMFGPQGRGFMRINLGCTRDIVLQAAEQIIKALSSVEL